MERTTMAVIVDPSQSICQPPLDPLPQIIPYASVNLLAGASGVGKTCLTAWLVTRFRDQLPIFGRQPNPLARIAYLCLDRGWSSTRVWLERVGYPDIPFYSLTDDDTFDVNKLHNKRARVVIFRECLAKLDLVPNSLVIVDPIALFMGGNLNDYDTCAVALIGIRRICQELGITIIGLSHASKQKNDRAEQYKRLQDRILGSAAQHGYGDTQMYLASPEETGERFYTFLWHPHLSKAETFPLGRDEKTGLFVPFSTLPLGVEEGRLLGAITLEGDGTTFAQIVEACTPIPLSTLHRYLQALVREGRVLRVGHGRYRKSQPS